MTGKVAITTIKNSKVVLTLIIYYLAVIVSGVLYLWNPLVIEAADSSFERNGDSSHHRTVSIVNDSGRTVEVYLISTTSSTTFTDGQSREEKLIETEWHSGEEVTLDSFVGDIFEIREKKVDKQGSVCDNLTIENEQDLACQLEQQAAVVTLTVREDDVEEQEYSMLDEQDEDDEEEGEEEGDDEEEEDNIVEEGYGNDSLTYVRVPSLRVLKPLRPPAPRSLCTDHAKAVLEQLKLRTHSTSIIETEEAASTVTEYISCMESNLTHELLKTFEELEFQFEALEQGFVWEFEEYTCADSNLPTSSPIRNETWTNKGNIYEVGILHDRPRSQIHILSDFITEEECRAIEEASAADLHVAVVADGKGGSEYTADRKAMQAGIVVPWDKEKDGNPIATLSRRVFDYVNHVSGLGIRENGQEEIMSIQYTGRGLNDTEPDRYKPHCDGDCEGLPLQLGGRFATMVMYCTLPQKGGATNFPYAGIHVAPKKGAATFFSYIGFDDLINDQGFSTHSGCPVYEGEKKIVTQWVRYGVDDDHPWDSFDV